MRTKSPHERFSQEIQNELASKGLKVIFRMNDREAWDNTFAKLEYKLVSMNNAGMDYYQEIEETSCNSSIDLSCIIVENNKRIALWALSITTRGINSEVTSHGNMLEEPKFVQGIDESVKIRTTKACYRTCMTMSKIIGASKIKSISRTNGRVSMSSWHINALKNGAFTIPSYEAYIDLEDELSDIFGSFRKSYRPLIRNNLNIWKTVIVTSGDEEHHWEEFRKIHFEAAGRLTRSDKSWELNKRSVSNNQAFLVMQYNTVGRIVGGSLFQITDDDAYYGVGAYARDLFNKPIGHIAQYRAIEEMKQRRIKRYRIGQCYFNEHNVVEKELSISKFKSGFTNRFQCNYILDHSL
ncbi:hypothetical protein N8645_00870 [bacterium]|nr:hypothetical protein [bacterium]